jgi:hypothetical protein
MEDRVPTVVLGVGGYFLSLLDGIFDLARLGLILFSFYIFDYRLCLFFLTCFSAKGVWFGHLGMG